MIKIEKTKKKTKNNTNLKDIHISCIIDKSSVKGKQNSFDVFNSINDILYIVYSNSNKSISCINLLNNQKINEIKKAHNNLISN